MNSKEIDSLIDRLWEEDENLSPQYREAMSLTKFKVIEKLSIGFDISNVNVHDWNSILLEIVRSREQCPTLFLSALLHGGNIHQDNNIALKEISARENKPFMDITFDFGVLEKEFFAENLSLEDVERILKRTKVYAFCQNSPLPDWDTALSMASGLALGGIVRAAIKNGADIHIGGDYPLRTAFKNSQDMRTAFKNSQEIKGYNISPDQKLQMEQSYARYRNIVDLLIENGADERKIQPEREKDEADIFLLDDILIQKGMLRVAKESRLLKGEMITKAVEGPLTYIPSFKR